MIDWSTCAAAERDPVRGTWVFRGTHVPIVRLFRALARHPGAPVEELVRFCGGVSPDHIQHALLHAADASLTIPPSGGTATTNRYALAHWIIPEHLAEQRDTFFDCMVSEHRESYFNFLWSRAEERTGYKALEAEKGDLYAKPGVLSDVLGGSVAILLTFPWPTQSGEAFFSAIVCLGDKDFEHPPADVRYLVLETGRNSVTHEPCTYFCEWRDGKHLNYGIGPSATFTSFVAHLENWLSSPELQSEQVQRAKANLSTVEATMSIKKMSEDPKFLYFEQVRSEMADIIEEHATQGQAVSLFQAYHLACLLNPAISAQYIAQHGSDANGPTPTDAPPPVPDPPMKH